MTPDRGPGIRAHPGFLVMALAAFALSAWAANRGVCAACHAYEEIWLSAADATAIHAQLFWPVVQDDDSGSLPAIVISPGYLANARYMRIPWVNAFTELGAAVWILDRRGQGRSDGKMWQPDRLDIGLDDLHPDLAASIAYLRSLAPRIDPERIALFGHSDGATAALIAGSADWEIRATVAISASTGPWQYINHVAPQNMLLVYGSDDRFVLDNTDSALITRGTRGEVEGEGEHGDWASGDRRRLLRVPDRGHLDVLTAPETWEESVRWLGRALDLPWNASQVRGHASRSWWITAGVLSLLAALAYQPAAGGARESLPWSFSSLARVFVPTATWAAGLVLFGGRIEPWLRPILPAQETSVFVMLIGIPAVLLGLLAVGIRTFDRLGSRANGRAGRPATGGPPVGAVRGLAVAAAVVVALKVLLWNHYEVSLTPYRVIVLALIAACIAPAFWLMVLSVQRLGTRGGIHPPHTASFVFWVLAGGAVLTAAFAPWILVRMSMGAGYLTAACLAATATYHTGLGGAEARSTAAFGACLLSLVAAVTCALY